MGSERDALPAEVKLLAQEHRSRLFCRDVSRGETDYLQFKGGEIEALLEQVGAQAFALGREQGRQRAEAKMQWQRVHDNARRDSDYKDPLCPICQEEKALQEGPRGSRAMSEQDTRQDKRPVEDTLHDVFTRHGIASRSDLPFALIGDLIRWAANECRYATRQRASSGEAEACHGNDSATIRVCERGTIGCVVRHASGEAEQPPYALTRDDDGTFYSASGGETERLAAELEDECAHAHGVICHDAAPEKRCARRRAAALLRQQAEVMRLSQDYINEQHKAVDALRGRAEQAEDALARVRALVEQPSMRLNGYDSETEADQRHAYKVGYFDALRAVDAALRGAEEPK